VYLAKKLSRQQDYNNIKHYAELETIDLFCGDLGSLTSSPHKLMVFSFNDE